MSTQSKMAQDGWSLSRFLDFSTSVFVHKLNKIPNSTCIDFLLYTQHTQNV